MTTWPSCLTACVVCATTRSPSLFFRASSEPESAASKVVPADKLAEFCPACAEAEVLLDAETPPEVWAFSFCPELSRLVLASCADAVHAVSAPASSNHPIRFIGNEPPCRSHSPNGRNLKSTFPQERPRRGNCLAKG